jgi:N-acetylglutamate synthase-like GNAT family acetyltransferase
MAVTDGTRPGIGKKLMEHCIKAAEDNHLEKIIIYSNRRLDLQLVCMKKYGFKEIPLEDALRKSRY